MRCYLAYRRWSFVGLTKSKWLLRQCKKKGHIFVNRESPYKRECMRCGRYEVMMGGGRWSALG